VLWFIYGGKLHGGARLNFLYRYFGVTDTINVVTKSLSSGNERQES
jgi:hypothetical protein